jgi:hypothetical protein
MFKKIILTIAFPGSALLFAQNSVLKIQLNDKDNNEMLEAAVVVVESAGVTACSGISDEKGLIVFKNLAPGIYNVKTSYTGYQKTMIAEVSIKNNETTYLNIRLSTENMMPEFIVDGYYIEKYDKPLIDPNTSIKTTFDHDDIGRSPFSDPMELLATVGGAVVTKEGMTPHYRGSRSESVVYIIDGQRVTGTYGLPKMAIEQMSVTLGGVPAMYGDATGAFIEIETRSGLVNPKKKVNP